MRNAHSTVVIDFTLAITFVTGFTTDCVYVHGNVCAVRKLLGDAWDVFSHTDQCYTFGISVEFARREARLTRRWRSPACHLRPRDALAAGG